jgi:hypothetical protein
MKSKREILFQLQRDTFQSCEDIIKAKNADYSDDDDPYSNFRSASLFGVHPAIGILLRVMDKIQRIVSFIKKDKLEVKGESFEDACDDIINYMVLIKGFLKDKQEQQNKCNTHQSLSQSQSMKKMTISTTRSLRNKLCAAWTRLVSLVSK